MRLSPSGLGPAGARDTTRFQASQQCGVFGYMAPEVYRRSPYGNAVDVFAFGQVLRRMLGALAPAPSPFSPRKAAAYALVATLAGCAPAWAYEALHCSPFALNAAWPADLRSLALACCSRDAGQRPKASALAESLPLRVGV